MAQTESSSRHIPASAITAVRGVAAVDEETAIDVLEAVRVYFDFAYLSRIAQLEIRVQELEAQLASRVTINS